MPLDADYRELEQRLAEVTDLRTVAELLFWDQTVKMPPAGGSVRAEQLATVQRVAHERFVDERVGELLEELRPYEESLDPESDAASLIRVARRDWEKERRVPVELASEMTKLASEAMEVWAACRRDSDYATFRPWLDRTLELKRRYVECFDAEDPYDALLDDYEPGLTTRQVEAVFARLSDELVPLVAAARDEGDDLPSGPYPTPAQHALSLELLHAFGFSEEWSRLDPTVHPFCSSSGTRDIRLTTRYSESELTSLFTAMHEGGHGLYEAGISPTLERTPLGTGCSMALHESQSRLWENVVGRSLPFWRWFYPRVQATFPDALGHVDVERFHRAVNRVRPSLIRVDADQTTYGLHILLRFELERELLTGDLSTADLPAAWNDRVRHYLGIAVPDDRHGVLQDVHWASGSFGYFPTYQLGNVIAAQIWEAARAGLPDVEAQIERGELHPLGDWLRENLYRHGRKFTPQETLARIVGGPIDPEPYLRYLEARLAA